MPELRYDPLQRRWVIIAAERARRPEDFAVRRDAAKGGEGCPFCPGNEARTPPEIIALRPRNTAPNTPGWTLRVVPNRFPALGVISGEIERKHDGIYETLSGVGAHEVIVETPDHQRGLADADQEGVMLVLEMYQERLRALMTDPRLKYALIFKNHGATAGASLEHPHSQIIATPITPRTVQIELLASRDHFLETGHCLLCDMTAQERSIARRVVYDDGTVIAYHNFAGRFPFELLVAPTRHESRYEDSGDETVAALARCLKDLLQRLKTALDDPPFNYILHTAPNIRATPRYPGYWRTLDQDYHWHIEVIPRLTRTAGFEWGSGLHINPMPPERATEFLREVKVE